MDSAFRGPTVRAQKRVDWVWGRFSAIQATLGIGMGMGMGMRLDFGRIEVELTELAGMGSKGKGGI